MNGLGIIVVCTIGNLVSDGQAISERSDGHAVCYNCVTVSHFLFIMKKKDDQSIVINFDNSTCRPV